MDNEYILENQYLVKVKDIVDTLLRKSQSEAQMKHDDIVLIQNEVREETSHSISNLWRADNFEQLVELNQFATLISDGISSYESTLKRIRQLETQLLSPYFARIDFKYDDNGDTAGSIMNIYIGRFSLMHDHKLFIYDWRSPIAGMFYRYGPGKASYDAPAGKLSGEISLKRQYEIKNGALEYFFDADIEILDEFLRKLLAKNASPQMKNIVETIQRDQDMVIRDIKNELLIVQGVAGSGKTSIALHRAAYLMYSGYSDKLNSDSIAIISPHELFEQYISNVLPELGEENITSFIMDEILSIVLGTNKIQSKAALFEALIVNKHGMAPLMKRSLEFKTSALFIRVLDNLTLMGNERSDIIVAYKNLFAFDDDFYNAAKRAGIAKNDLPENIDDILQFTRENLNASYLFFDDASALAYLYLKRSEFDELMHMRHIIIDEAQDYYNIHFEIFKLLFPLARCTILGDISQTIEKHESMDFYEDILYIFNKRKSSIITLDKSFRCSNEILEFSARFTDAKIKAFSRASGEVEICRVESENEVQEIAQEVLRLKEHGYKSVGIICKSEMDASGLFLRLSKHIEISLIKNSTSSKLEGAFILPVYLSKGLEFDAALIYAVDSERYRTDDDKKLLYIACTRALHKLKLYYSGKLSHLCMDTGGTTI